MFKIKFIALLARARLKRKLSQHQPTSRRDKPSEERSSLEPLFVPVERSSQQRLLGEFPADVVLELFMHLDVADVLSLAQVSHMFLCLSQSLSVWRNLAFKLMCRGRRVSLHDYLSTSALTTAQLKHSVLMTTAAEQSWNRDRPKSVASPRIVRLENVDLDHASYVMKFTSRRHLVLPTKAGELIGWDTRTSARAGHYSMGPDAVLINVQGDYATRSLYWITGKMSSDPDFVQNLHLKILRIQFPEPTSSLPVAFEDLGDLITPWSLAAELHFLDASQKMLCAVFECSDTGSTGLHVVLNWKSGLSYICDTGIPYEYGRAVIGLHLSDDRLSIILHTEHWGTEIRRAYSLAFIRSRASIWSPSRSLAHPLPTIQPTAETAFPWAHDRAVFSDRSMTPHTVWVLPQWWPTYPGVPRRSSTIILYLTVEESSSGLRRVWRATQHYSSVADDRYDADVGAMAEAEDKWENKSKGESKSKSEASTQVLAGGPCAHVRSVIEIKDPVLISLGHNGLPILAQSFNHLGWIEEREYDAAEDCAGGRSGRLRARSWLSRRKSRRRQTRRALKLVTFPDPDVSPRSPHCTAEGVNAGYCECTTLVPVTLDVPDAVLDGVYHMFLDPAAGTITLATENNELHVYQYGRPSTS
ncbi:hypothetical protein DFH11DRAFT_1877694 [Phellopilus nigrolimitatus]|nr:hypothetical protein DFH11DRAFT_1877694 [Phellopilus nigrolimitatus]